MKNTNKIINLDEHDEYDEKDIDDIEKIKDMSMTGTAIKGILAFTGIFEAGGFLSSFFKTFAIFFICIKLGVDRDTFIYFQIIFMLKFACIMYSEGIKIPAWQNELQDKTDILTFVFGYMEWIYLIHALFTP